MNKAQAAEFIGCSVRAVERYVSSGRLPAKYVKGKTGQVLDIEQSDALALKTELETPQHRATVENPDKHRQNARQGSPVVLNTIVAPKSDNSDNTALARLDGPQNPNALAMLQAFYTMAQAASDNTRKGPTVPTEAKLVVTIPEASALTGFSRETLRDAIESGELKAKRIGRPWRIKRADLDRYIAKL